MADEIINGSPTDDTPPLSLLWPATTYKDNYGRTVLVQTMGVRNGKDEPLAVSDCRVESLALSDFQEVAERHTAGRYTLVEYAIGFAEKTDIDCSRWLNCITNAVNAGQLQLRNPRNLADKLPYKVPAIIQSYDDQISTADVNAWLSHNPGWGIPAIPSEFVLPETESHVALFLPVVKTSEGTTDTAKCDTKIYKKSAAISALSDLVQDPSMLKSLFSNASKTPELKACRAGTRGWHLPPLIKYLSEHNYLKPEYQAKAGENAFIKSLELS